MTRKQLQCLISAGVFSAALLSGAAYADDTLTAPAATQPASQPTNTQAGSDSSAQTGTDKSNSSDQSGAAAQKDATSSNGGPAQHGCAGAGGCSGK